MESTIEALESNYTCELILLPPRQFVIGSKWVYTTKLELDGSLDIYKACLVSQGYN